VHHVTVHAIGPRLSVSLDLEVDGEMSLGGAHGIADSLEDAIADELGPDVEVETHIEPLQPISIGGREAPTDKQSRIGEALIELAKASPILRDIHDVRVRETDEGEIVNFHCLADARQSVSAVHEQVDELERAVRREFPTIKRVIGHTEPSD
jgi:divalent metal cation (Fe/Co/Zn/Cd) transporter